MNNFFIRFEYWNDNSGFSHRDPDARCGFLLKILGKGFKFYKGPLLFSERNGHLKYIQFPFGFRLRLLK